MTTICVYTDYPNADAVHARLDMIADRIPCFAAYVSSSGEIVIKCRVEDAAWAEQQIADFV